MSDEALKVERWVGEGIIKCAHIVLSSRIYRCSRTLPPRSRSNWFKLEVEEVEDAASQLERYRKDVSEPLVIEIYLQPWPDGKCPQGQEGKEQLLERWEFEFDGVPPTHQHRSFSNFDDMPTLIYKRMVVMVRSLYTYVRVLPAYRLYRSCREQQATHFNIDYRISASLLRSDQKPQTQKFERFALASIETPTGNLKIAVEYQSQHLVAALHAITQPVSIPQHVIPDYILQDGGRQTDRGGTSRAMAASVYVGPTSGATGGLANVGYGLLNRAVSVARAGSHRIMSGGRMPNPDTPPFSWTQHTPNCLERSSCDAAIAVTGRPSRLSGSPTQNTLLHISESPDRSPRIHQQVHTSPPSQPLNINPINAAANAHLALHPPGPSPLPEMPSSAPNFTSDSMGTASPYARHIASNMRKCPSQHKLDVTTVGFQTAPPPNDPQSNPLIPPPAGALQHALTAYPSPRGRPSMTPPFPLPRTTGARGVSAGSSVSCTSAMSCSPAAAQSSMLALVACRQPGSSHSMDVASLNPDRRPVLSTVDVTSDACRYISPRQVAFDVSKRWSVGTSDDDIIALGRRLSSVTVSIQGNSIHGSGLANVEGTVDDARAICSLHKADSLEAQPMFEFDADDSGRRSSLLRRSSKSAVLRVPTCHVENVSDSPADSTTGEPMPGPGNTEPESGVQQSENSNTGVLQDLTASAPTLVRVKSAANRELDLKNFINMLCRGDEFVGLNCGADQGTPVLSVQEQLERMSEHWAGRIY